jgi:hypothetical protein
MNPEGTINKLKAVINDRIDRSWESIRREMVKRGTDESRKFFLWLSRQAINRTTPTKQFSEFLDQPWRQLTPAYIKKKGHERFFYLNSPLKGFFDTADPTVFLGHVTTMKVRGTDEFAVYPFDRRLTSGSRGRGGLESALDFGGASRVSMKLMGRTVYRPLLGPGLQSFIQYVWKKKMQEHFKDVVSSNGFSSSR